MLIIAAEALTAPLCWIGAIALMRQRWAPAAAFDRAKACAIAGLALGFLTWQFGFMTVGGEWFGMWRSAQRNGAASAFRFAMVVVAVLILVTMPEVDGRASG